MIPYAPQPDGSFIVHAGMMIDGDGSPHCSAPEGSGLPALDYLANAGRPGDWWGLARDGEGKPYIQGQNAPAYDSSSSGFYVSTTSLTHKGYAQNDPMHYLNAEVEKYVVVPRRFLMGVKGIVLGCRCLVTNTANGLTCEAVSGDVGPEFGEASIAVAKVLSVPGSPKSGGVSSGIIYQFWPGIAAQGYSLQPS
jgi:hypothetical protein